MGILDNDLRKRLLQMPDLTINLCIDMCHAYEATENRMRYMEAAHKRRCTVSNIHALRYTRRKGG